jgi:hypothetical protein
LYGVLAAIADGTKFAWSFDAQGVVESRRPVSTHGPRALQKRNLHF